MPATQQDEIVTKPRRDADAKWAAVVQDRLAPMPRRRLKARDILHQSGATADMVLVRDYDSPNDIGFEPDTLIDLAEGNVFRTVASCTCSRDVACDGPVKLAFVVDDRWEVTIQPQQTGTTLRGLLAVPDSVDLFRDHESPRDEPIEDEDRFFFAAGPVFVTLNRVVIVKVNNNAVKFKSRKTTGLGIKRTAIEQGVRIELGFVLYRVNPDGGLGASIGDTDEVVLKDCDEFRCVAPDDNS